MEKKRDVKKPLILLMNSIEMISEYIPNGQELVYTGINTAHKFTALGNKTAKAVNVDTSVNTGVKEITFFEEVQTPDTVTVAA